MNIVPTSLLPLFIQLRMIDLLDILLVALLLYIIYQLIRKTVAMNIFIGILAIYIIWKLVTVFQMVLLSEILGQFISVGVIALLIVFQQELRKFLLLLGTPKFMPGPFHRIFRFRHHDSDEVLRNTEVIVQSVEYLSAHKTGALMILVRDNKLPDTVATGVIMNAVLSEELLKSIFFKNNPLHDGAVIIDGENVRASRCILPVSGNQEIPSQLGTRHRAAIGITEQSDAIAVIVSEETGSVSYAMKGEITVDVKPVDLRRFLPEEWVK